MELDELRQKWAEHDRKLETSIRLNQQLVRDLYTRPARSALVRLAVILGLGLAGMILVVFWLGSFISSNWGNWPLVVSGIALDVFFVAAIAAQCLQLVLALETDYDQPVTVIQKRLERLRQVRIRYVQAVFLFAALLWVPMLVVGMACVFHVDVYETFDRTWLWANVLFGVAVIPVGVWMARKFGARVRGSHVGRRILDDLAGYNLKSASAFIERVAQFEREG